MFEKMKRIISLLCAIVISVSMFTVPALANTQSTEKISNAAGLLTVLKITDTTFDSDSYSEMISRADFVLCVAKIIMGNSAEQSNDITYYEDVPTDFWALKEINALVENGVLTVSSDRMFRPDEPIKKAEAMKILLSLMKYDTYCKIQGGYPQGYINVAYENDMGDNLTSGEYMTCADAIMLIYNALEVPMAEISYNGSTLYENETLLSYYFDTYSVRGQVTSAGGMVTTGDKAYDGEISIDGQKYYLENTDALMFLGQNVKAYIRQNSEDDMDTVIAIEEQSRKNKILEIDVSDFAGFDTQNYKLKYYKENGKTDTVDLSKGIMVLKNGENVSDSLNDAFVFSKGVIKLVDNNGDEVFDYAFNSSYRNIIVGYIDEEAETIYDRFDNQNKLPLADYYEKSINIFNGGKRTNFAAIKEGMILTVFDSAEYVKIEVSTESVSGTVFKFDAQQKEILVGVTETESDLYTVTPEYINIEGEALKVGASGTFYLDSYKKIAYGEIKVDSAYKYAYVKKIVDSSEDDYARLNLFIQDGGHYSYICSSKLKVDGISKKSKAEQKLALQGCEGEIVRIRLNGEEIVAIETAKPVSEAETAESFCKTRELTSLRYVYSQKRFGLTTMHSTDTVFFVVPSDSAPDDKSLYRIVDRTFFVSSKSYNVESYKLNHNEPYENVILAKLGTSVPIGTQTMFLVDEKYIALDSNNEPVTKVKGFNGGSATELVLANSCDADGIDSGDIIKVSGKDIDGRILQYTMMYDYDDPSTHWEGNSVSDHYNSYNYMCANVIDIKDNILKVGFSDISTVNVMFDMASLGPIIIYDANARGASKAHKGSKSELIPSNYCSPNCSKIVAWVSSGAIKWMVAYK